MQQILEIKVKYSKGDLMFIHKENPDREPNCLIPVSVDRVANIKMLGSQANTIITYSVSTIKKNLSLEVNEIDLYSLDELGRFLK